MLRLGHSKVGSQLLAIEITESSVWAVWATEAMNRQDSAAGRAQQAVLIRRRIARQWGVKQLPAGLEVALRGVSQPTQ